METAELDAFLRNHTKEAPNLKELDTAYQPKTVHIGGNRVYLFDMIFDLANNPTGDQLVISPHVPNAQVPMHVHPYIEMVYVYRGRCTALVNDLQIPLTRGGIMLIDKMTPHTLLKLSPDDIVIDMKLRHDYLSVGFLNRFTTKSIISQFLISSLTDTRRTSRFLHFPLEGVQKTNQIMEQLMCEYFDRGLCSYDIINSYLVILLTELIRHTGSSGARHSIREDGDASIVDFLKYIEDHYRECTLAGMAAHFSFHPNSLSAILKRATGHSFKDLLQLQRLNKAALYLINTDLPVTDIAGEVGYSSMSFFHKKFKEVYGETPNHYRSSRKTTAGT